MELFSLCREYRVHDKKASQYSGIANTKIEDDNIFEAENSSYSSFNVENIDQSKYEKIQPKKDRALGFLWETNTYTYTTSNGVKITVENVTDDIQVLEDKEVGEVIIIGAEGAIISGSSANCKISVYDSTIKKIDTSKGDDEIRIYDSIIAEIDTGRGNDTVITKNTKIENINTGRGDDYVSIVDSEIEKIKTGKRISLTNDDDTVVVENSKVKEVSAGCGSDRIVTNNASIKSLKTNGNDNSISLNKTNVEDLKVGKKNTIVYDNDYKTNSIDTSKIQEVKSEAVIPLDEEGTSIKINDFVEYSLSQEFGFEATEEYYQYTIEYLESNYEAMEQMFNEQLAKDGVISDGYNYLKELTGLGISDDDIRNMLSRQKEAIEGLKKALNGESDMTFEEAYRYYMGTDFSKEKIDNYMRISNTYKTLMTAAQFDPDYLEEFEKATGMSIETVAKEYYLSKTDALGKDLMLSEMVEKYQLDQNSFADKISAVISTTGIVLTAVGAILCLTGVGSGIGGILMVAGKYITLGGMFIDNTMDIIDDATDKDGLTSDEFKNFAIETGVEAATYYINKRIGKFTSNVNDVTTQKLASLGTGKILSSVLGQGAEVLSDGALSIGADLVISEAASIASGKGLYNPSEFFTAERFISEGRNQLFASLNGIAQGKLAAHQQKVFASAGERLATEDPASIKTYMKKQGIPERQINKFFTKVDIEACAENSTLSIASNPALVKMVKSGKISQSDADILVKYGLSDSQIKDCLPFLQKNVSADEAAICVNHGLNYKGYKKASSIHSKNWEYLDFQEAAIIVSNPKICDMVTKNELSPLEAQVYIKHGLTTKTDIEKAMEFGAAHPEATEEQVAIIVSNKTVLAMYNKEILPTVEDAVLYAKSGLSEAQIETATKLQKDTGISASDAVSLINNKIVFDMYNNGEIASIEAALRCAKYCKTKEEVNMELNPSNRIYLKFLNQLGVISKEDINTIVKNITGEMPNVTEEQVLQILLRLTQYSSFASLPKLAEQLRGLDVKEFYSKGITTSTALSYIQFNKEQFSLKTNSSEGKKAFIVDDISLKYLEQNPTTLEALQEGVKNGTVVLIQLDGSSFKIGENYASFGIFDGTSGLESVVKELLQAQTRTNLTTDELLNRDIQQRTKALFGEDIEIKLLENKSETVDAAAVSRQLRPLYPTEAQIRATVDTIAKNYSENPEKQAIAKSVLYKYYDYMLFAYSSDSMVTELRNKYSGIEKEVLSKGKTMEDVIYIYPEEHKSFELVCLEFAKANGIDPSKFIQWNGTGEPPVQAKNKVFVLLDDVVGSGDSMLNQRFIYIEFLKNATINNNNLVFSPIMCAVSGENNIRTSIKNAGRSDNDSLIYNPTNKVNIEDFKKTLSEIEQNTFGQITDSNGYGYHKAALCTSFPYMIPDNCSGISGYLLRHNLLKDTAVANKAGGNPDLVRAIDEAIRNIEGITFR